MIIEKIKRDKCHTAKLTLSNKKEVNIDVDVCTQFSLFCGMEIDEGKLKELIATSDYVRCKNRALWYLDRMPRTEKNLKEKLKNAGFSAETVLKVTEKLKEYSLVDDVSYAQNFLLKCESQNLSRRQIYCKMIEKGLPRAIIEDTLGEKRESETQKIAALIEKKYKNKLDTKESKEKVFASLIRKGFSFGDVKNAISHFCESDEFYGEY